MNKPYLKLTLVLLSIGALATIAYLYFSDSHTMDTQMSAEDEPLYWVAPMDHNYRRDEPGKSPMGMDLVPVYAESKGANDAGPGTINISPDVVNNLGVRTALVERKPLHSQLVTVGYVQYDEDSLVHIHPRVSGWIEKLYIKSEGEVVKRGNPLYTLYSPELVSAQEELVLALSRNNDRLIQAAESRLRALQIPRNVIQNIKQNKSIQQGVVFYAPQSGIVDNLNVREGFFVQPGTTMLSIGSLDEVWVEAEIFERQSSLVKEGDLVTMTLDYLPGRVWNGKIDYIYPILDRKTRTIRLRLRFKNVDYELKPNMFAQVTVHVDSVEDLLVIPREALIRTGSQDRVVLDLGEGSFKSIAVRTGRLDQDMAEIIEGLSEGERVVSSAQFLLDSESSKTSDFKRMAHGKIQPDSVWAEGEIQDVMVSDRMVTASHDEIDAWDWPSMTMDFRVNDEVDIEQLNKGTILHMEITKQAEGEYEITGVHIMAENNGLAMNTTSMSDMDTEKQSKSVWTEGEIQEVLVNEHMVMASHEVIEAWGWPSMTMEFSVSESVDIGRLTKGTILQMEITERSEGEYEITGVHIMAENNDLAMNTTSMSDMDTEKQSKSVWTEGEIQEVLVNERMVMASHEAIEAWSWPKMTMEFSVSETVDIGKLTKGTKLHMEITERAEGEYEITSVHIISVGVNMNNEFVPKDGFIQVSGSKNSSVWIEGEIREIMEGHRVKATHEAIEAWGWPKMTMEFSVSETVDIGKLTKGTKLHMEITERAEGEYEITSVHIISVGVNMNNEFVPKDGFIEVSGSKSSSVWVEGEIREIMEGRRVKATHEAIGQWGWPKMTMEFSVSETVDIGKLTKGTKLHMEITERAEREYEITSVHIISGGVNMNQVISNDRFNFFSL